MPIPLLVWAIGGLLVVDKRAQEIARTLLSPDPTPDAEDDPIPNDRAPVDTTSPVPEWEGFLSKGFQRQAPTSQEGRVVGAQRAEAGQDEQAHVRKPANRAGHVYEGPTGPTNGAPSAQSAAEVGSGEAASATVDGKPVAVTVEKL